MLIRFHNYDDPTTTTTVKISKLRAISLLTSLSLGYYVRLSFDNGQTVIARAHLDYEEACKYRDYLEQLWDKDVHVSTMPECAHIGT